MEDIELICNLLVNVLTELLITVCSCSHKENKNASYCIIQQPKATIFLQRIQQNIYYETTTAILFYLMRSFL